MSTDTETPLKRYVVVSDAAVVTVGTKSNGRANYTRVLRGGVLQGNPKSDQIVALLRLKSIKNVKTQTDLEALQADLKSPTSKHRQTAKAAAAAAGAPDDPVKIPDEVFAKPMSADYPVDNKPGAITQADIDGDDSGIDSDRVD